MSPMDVYHVLGEYGNEEADGVCGKLVCAMLCRGENARVQRHEQEAENLRPEVRQGEEADVLGESAIAPH